MDRLFRTLHDPDPDGGGGAPPPPEPPKPPPAPPAPPAPPKDEPKSWRDQFLTGEFADLAKDPTLQEVPDVPTLAKRTVDLRAKLGGMANSVKVPGKDAKPEEVAAFHKAIGKPEKAEEYELPTQGLPEGYKSDEASDKAFKDVVHGADLTKTQAAKLYRKWAEMRQQGQTLEIQNREAAKAGAEQTLRGEWGAAYDQNMKLADLALRKFGGQDFADHLIETGLGNDVRAIKAWAQIGKLFVGDEILGEGSGRDFVMSPNEAQLQINKLMADAEFTKAYTDPTHPDHAAAKEKFTKLHKMAAPA